MLGSIARVSELAIVRALVCAGLCAGLLLSPKLWLSSRLYPFTPVWAAVKPFPAPFDTVVFAALLVLVAAAAFVPWRAALAPALLLMAVLALQDQSRWQPWFYQYALMLVALVCCPAPLDTCRIMIAALYFWSGLEKLNPKFISEEFPWLMAPFVHSLPAALRYAALVVPIAEVGMALALLARPLRRAAVLGLILMHLFILTALGPLGHNSNTVVWPWNVAMMALVTILFWREGRAGRCFVRGKPSLVHDAILVLFAVMPALGLFGLWDDYLSFALYSGNKASGIIYLTDAACDRLPDGMDEFIDDETGNGNKLDISNWSNRELNVPPYPEPRIFRSIAAQIRAYSAKPADVRLVIQPKITWFPVHGRAP